MPKIRVVVYVDAGLLGKVDSVAMRSAVSRSAVISAAIAEGIGAAGTRFAPRRRGQGARLFGRPSSPFRGPGRSPATAQQRKAITLGESLLRVNSALEPEEMREALLAELPAHLPGVQPDTLDLDGIVDALYASHDGDLVPVPGQEPPE